MCWPEGGCTVGTDWRSPLLSWGLGLVALDLVRTISALFRRKKSQNPTMEFKRYSSPQTAPTDESSDISGLKVPGLDEFVTGSWENKQKTQRRPVEAGQEPSDGEVSLFYDFVNWKSQKIRILYSFIGKRLYSMRGTVTYLVTVPTIGESKRLRDNFHNWRRS